MSTYTERIRKSREAQNGVPTGSTYTERQTIKRLNSGTDTLFDDYKAVEDSHNKTLNGIKSYSDMSEYKPSGGFDFDSLTANAQSRKLLSDRLKRYRSAYANAYGEDKIQALENSLKQIKASQDSTRQVVDGIDKFRSQFKNEDEYSQYLAEQKKAADFDTLSKMSEDDIANALENGSRDIDSDNIKAYIKYRGSGKLLDVYKKIIESDKNTPTAVTVWNGLIPTEQVIVDNSDEQKQELAELEKLSSLREDSEYAQQLYNEYSALPDWKEKKNLTAKNKNRNYVNSDHKYDVYPEEADDGYIGSEKIKELYSYIYNTQGEDKAHEFFDSVSRLNNYRGAANEERLVRSFADQFPILSTIGSTGANILNGLAFVPVADAVDTALGVPLDTNDSRHTLSRIAAASRDEVGKNIDSEVGSFLYNTATSAIDSAANILLAKKLTNGTALSKYVPEVTSALMGNQVAANAIIEGKEKGYSDGKAVALGIIQGAIEGITEKYSIEAILKQPKTAFQGFLKAFAAEGSEEVAANWLNRIVDGVVNADQSDFKKSVRKYLKEHPEATQEEALAHAVLGNIGEDALSFLAGGISGAAMYGSFQGYNKVQERAANKQSGKAVKSLSNENQLIEFALQQDENSKAYRLAKKYKADSKKSAVKLGAVQSALMQQVYDNHISALPAAVQSRFSELGVQSSEHLNRAVVKTLTGETTNRFDEQLIKNSPQAQQIISEYRSTGENTAKWVQDIDNSGVYRQIAEFSQKPLDTYKQRVVSTLPEAQQEARHGVQATGKENTTVNGKAAEIDKIQGVEDGVVTYLMTDGSTQTSDSIDFSDDAAVLDAYASAMSEEEAKAYYDNYQSGDIDTYTMEWNAARICGMAHLPERMSGSSLTPEQFTAAYKIGVLQKADETERRQKAVDNAVIRFNEGGGIYRQGSVKTSGIRHLNGNLTAQQEQSLKAIRDIARVLGVDVEVFASKTKDGRFTGKNGSFDPDTGKIMIDINAGANEVSRLVTDGAMMRTFSHELTHYIQAYSPKLYEELKAYVLDTLTKQGQNIEQLAKEKISRSQNEMSHEKALDEIIADGCEMMLKDSKAVNEIAKKHTSLAKRIKNFIGKFIEKIRKAFEGVSPHSREAAAIANSIEDFKHIQNMWDKALINAAEAYQAQKQTQKNTAVNTAEQESADTQNSDRDIDDRAILAYTMRNLSRDSAEYQKFSGYIEQLDSIEDLEEWLDDVEGQIYDEYRKPKPDKEHLKALQKTKRSIKSDIAELDKALIELEAAKPIRDLLAVEKEKIRRSESEKYKQKLKDELTKVKENRQRERERRRERRKVKEYKEKIRKVCNRFGAMITRRNADTALPVDLVKEIASLADIIDAGVTRTGNPVSGYSKFKKLKDIYDTLQSQDYKTDDKYDKFDKNIYTQAYAEEISSAIDSLAQELGGRAINELDGTQLEKVYDLLDIIDKNLRQARQVLIDGEWHDIHETGESILKEMHRLSGVKNRRGQYNMLKLANEQYSQWTLSPIRYAKHITGYNENSALLPFFKALEEAEGKAVSIRREGLEIFDDIVKMFPKRFDSFTGKKAEFIDFGITDRKTGETVRITPAMAVSIYRQSQNESNRRAFMELYDEDGNHVPHVMGGLKVPSEKNYKAGKTHASDHTVIISQQSLDSIKRYIDNDEFLSLMSDAVYDFFNIFSTKHLNDTSIQLYGIPISLKGEYFPIHRDSNFLGKDAEALVRDFTLENSGFTKERVQSSSPIMLEDVSDVVMKHLDGIARYASLTVPLRNFNKIYNYKAVGMSTSLRETIEHTWGESANAYIDKMLTDLQSPPKSDYPIFSKIRGKFAQAVLSANLSVAMKQAASYPTAAAVLGWKPLLKALRTDGSGALKPIYRADSAEIDEITDLYWDRKDGVNNVYDYTDMAQKNFVQNLAKKAPKLMKWIESIDVATVGRLFKASQFYVEEQYPQLQKGTAEYKTKLKEVFEEVIRSTQPIYSTMNRPGILRTNNDLIKSITMFMTQRLQNTGIFFEATGNLAAKISEYHQHPTIENHQAFIQARTKWLHSVSALIVSNAVLGLMSLLYNIIRGTMDKYRDDEGEVTAEAIIEKLGWDFAETALGNLLFGSEIVTEIKNLIEAVKDENAFYSESVFEVNVFDNLNNCLNDLSKITRYTFKNINGDPTEEEAKSNYKAIAKASENFVFTVLQPLGIPVTNAKNLLLAVKNNGHDLYEGNWGKFKSGSSVDLKPKDYASAIYRNILNGDKARATELFNQAIDKGFESKKLWDSLARVLMNDDTLTAAAEAKYSGNDAEYKEKIKVLHTLGFKDTVTEKAVKLYNNKHHPENKEKKKEEKRTYLQGELFN